MWVLTFRLFPHKGEAVAEGDDLGWHNLARRIGAAVTARGYNSCSILAIIQSLNFRIELSGAPRAAIHDDAFIRAINVSAIIAGVSATAIPAACSASIFPAAVPFPPETIAPA